MCEVLVPRGPGVLGLVIVLVFCFCVMLGLNAVKDLYGR